MILLIRHGYGYRYLEKMSMYEYDTSLEQAYRLTARLRLHLEPEGRDVPRSEMFLISN